MRRTMAPVVAISGVMAIFALGCPGNSPDPQPAPEVKDSHVRLYIQDSLVPYLDSLAKEICAEHKRENQPETWLCDPEGDTYTKPPTNGKP